MAHPGAAPPAIDVEGLKVVLPIKRKPVSFPF